MGERGVKKQFDISVDAFQSEALKQFLRTSALTVQCKQDMAAGNRITKPCEQLREKAASLDQLTAKAAVPVAWTENSYVAMVEEYVMYWLAPYVTMRTSSWSSSSSLSAQETREVEVEMSVGIDGNEISGSIKSDSSETAVNSVPLPYLSGLLPVCTRESQLTRLMQKLSRHGLPSRCVVENNRVKSFDEVKYDYNMGECEHVVFKECTANPRVEVSVKKGAAHQIVKAVIDGEAYHIKLLKHGRGLSSFSAEVTYNGESRLLTSSRLFQEDSVLVPNNHIQVRMFEDGVVEFHCSKYGVTVYADVAAVEVVSYKMLLRDRTCGLCGDINDERTGDVKSAEECIMSSPVLAAYSFMVKDAACQGVPAQHLQQFMEETRVCKKKTIIPTLL